MRAAAGAAVVLALFLAANIVAAAIVLGLGLLFRALAPGSSSPWPWVVICGAAAIAAYYFLKWSLKAVPAWLARR